MKTHPQERGARARTRAPRAIWVKRRAGATRDLFDFGSRSLGSAAMVPGANIYPRPGRSCSSGALHPPLILIPREPFTEQSRIHAFGADDVIVMAYRDKGSLTRSLMLLYVKLRYFIGFCKRLAVVALAPVVFGFYSILEYIKLNCDFFF